MQVFVLKTLNDSSRPVVLKISRLLLCLLLLSSLPASAKIYKWVDADGNVHYSDKKPAAAGHKGGKVEDISGQLPSANVDASHRSNESLGRVLGQRKQDDAQRQKKRAQQGRQKAKACTEAKRWLARYRSRSYFRYGEDVSEAKRQELVNKAERDVSRHCS